MLDLRMETFDLDRIIEIIKEYEGAADIFVTGNRNAFIKAFTDNLKAIADALGYKKIKAGYLRLGREVVLVVIEDTHEHSFTVENTSGKYLKSEATCKQKAVYYYSCECGECGTETFEYGEFGEHKYGAKYSSNEETHWHECTVCGDKKDEAEHVYNYVCSPICNKCDYEREVSHKFKDGWEYGFFYDKHHRYCTICNGIYEFADHEYTDDCDKDCNICGYRRTDAPHKPGEEWVNDGHFHWHICTACGGTVDWAQHRYKIYCDTECTICGYKREPDHVYAPWEKNAEKHWHICYYCKSVADEAEHVYDNACDTDCNVCGEKRTTEHNIRQNGRKTQNRIITSANIAATKRI